jgi:glycosyltransferase involved in cell wall biosynthesis
MRILLVTQYFYPENFKSNDIAFELAKRGYKVDVLCGLPNYPEGRIYKGYGVFRKRIEKRDGVNIYRALQVSRGTTGSKLRLLINYFSYVVFGSIWAICLAMFRKYDCVLVHETSPITQAVPAIIVKKMQRIPFYIWVLDIWPDAMTSGGGIKNKQLIDQMTKFVKWVYNNAEKIMISSRGFEALIAKLDEKYQQKIVYFPNWADDVLRQPKCDIPQLPDGYKIMMAGNLGSAQTIKSVMQATLLLKQRKDIKWIFVGDGSEKKYMEEFVVQHNLHDTVFLMGRFPSEYMGSFFAQADAMLITLRAKFPHIRAVVPARLQSYMSSGKPIIGMADGGVADLIREADCGLCVHAEDYTALCQAIVDDIIPNKETFSQKGSNGRAFYEKNFTTNRCINNLETIINTQQ